MNCVRQKSCKMLASIDWKVFLCEKLIVSMTALYILIVLVFLVWLIFAIYRINLARKDFPANQPYLLIIPPGFATIGIIGTFLGIAIGLKNFDVDNIDNSIPTLLEGLKTAFYTSIAGISLSLVFSGIISWVHARSKASGAAISPEQNSLNELGSIMQQGFDSLNKSINSESDGSLTTHLEKMRLKLRDNHKESVSELSAMRDALGGDGETSMLTQLIKLRNVTQDQIANQTQLARFQQSQLQELKEQVQENGDLMERKFDEFSTLMAKSNTEALVEAIENVIGGFNDRLNELIEKLVKENFEELNNSVQRLNEWQQENKSMIQRLTDHYKSTADTLSLTSNKLEELSGYSERISGSSGKMSKILKELQDVMLESTKFKENTVFLNEATSELKDSSVKMNEWLKREQAFADSVGELITSLKEIHELRDSSSKFWADIKTNMNDGVDIIKDGNSELQASIERLEQSFQARQDQSFQALDQILKAMTTDIYERLYAIIPKN